MTVTTKEYQDAFKIVIERLCKKKEFSCIKCKKWIANVGDGLHDTCEAEWKSFEEYGLCYECSSKEKDLDLVREKFQSSIDEIWEAVYGPHACINPKCKGEREHYKKNREFHRKMKKLQNERKEDLK